MAGTSAAGDSRITIYLIGDAGEPAPGAEPVFRALAEDAANVPARRIVLFLGDNVYPRGMPAADDDGRGGAERRLAAQIAIVTTAGAEGIFIPGNHDWDFAGAGRREQLLRAAAFGRSFAGDSVCFLPRAGCPGPEAVDIDEHVRLILLDTQWWLFPEPAEDVPASCAQRTRSAVLEALRGFLDTAGGRRVIVAGHHPLTTRGPHGGYFTLRQHIFPLTDKWPRAWIPLPLLGSLYPLARRLGISDQDLAGRRNRRMRAALERVLAESPPLVYAAGHEHSLQVSTATAARWHVVSGAGNYGRGSPVGHGRGTVFATSASGYVRLTVHRDGPARLAVMAVEANGTATEAYSTWLA